MAGDALRALAVSVKGHGSAERSRSGSQRLKGSLQAPPGILCGSQQQVGRDRPCPPFPGFRCPALPSPICFQNLLDGSDGSDGLFAGRPRPSSRTALRSRDRRRGQRVLQTAPAQPRVPAHRDTARVVHWHLDLLLQAEGDQGGAPGERDINQDSRLRITAPDSSSSSRQVRDALGPQRLTHGCVQPHPSHTHLCAEVTGRAGLPGGHQAGGLQKGFLPVSDRDHRGCHKPCWGKH